ncbi:hypothetical protein QOQ01_001265 [Salmonella enterica]|uniref:Transposase n=1 Tax=Salmonella enterica subsp. diarizonae serovar 48:i:z TaxID=1192842 RepID=A0A7U6BGY6_SALDZ|nr:hypothetical protein DOE59_09925 [Salmonella enterica subsp. diarizonae serovar 48:i:z]AXD12054.1 hypothetical protein CHE29_09695 [Salmonella enterica]ECI4529957.1 hypothetical protein [Salmonella enterica subsp. diarizonae]EKO0997995.1 hypothetical protein [Salmonella enterica subsp. enterica]HCM1946364.1 hypothetical protein [Salmonella enterica subsp. diarizonae serovar 65:z10:e,n,x,z15]HCS9548883.1 hypothetical protein [Salmonella enterica subsp. diarizonae serovar 61:r:z53]
MSDTVRTTESGHKHRYQNLKKLLTKQVINIGFITTDDWGSYEHEVPPEIHLSAKHSHITLSDII